MIGAGPAGEEKQPPALDDPGLLHVLATEHWSLLATRSLTYSESLSRVSMFLSVLSGAVIALALVAQADHFGNTFVLVAILILSVVLFVGVSGNRTARAWSPDPAGDDLDPLGGGRCVALWADRPRARRSPVGRAGNRDWHIPGRRCLHVLPGLAIFHPIPSGIRSALSIDRHAEKAIDPTRERSQS